MRIICDDCDEPINAELFERGEIIKAFVEHGHSSGSITIKCSCGGELTIGPTINDTEIEAAIEKRNFYARHKQCEKPTESALCIN